MYCRSIRFSLVLLQLHVALQLLWTPSSLGAADISNHLDGVQASNGNVWRKPSVDDEVQEHSFHSRTLSQRRSSEQLNNDDFPCSLDETEREAILNETTRIWLVSDDVLSMFNIQDIINCTTVNDTVLIRTENTIRLQSTITIPWNLALSGFFEGSLTGTEGVPEAVSKVSFTCPENGQLIWARTPSFMLANVAVIGCDSSSDIILLDPRCADDLESNARSHLVHVDFARNTLLQNGNLLNATQAFCTQLTLENVEFTRNRCNGQGCVLISTNTELYGIRAVRNRNSSDSPEECSFFSIQDASEVVATNVSALKNEIRVLRILNSSMRIRDSHFERNNRTLNSASPDQLSGGGALFANQSTVSIDSSTFQDNTAWSGGALNTQSTNVSLVACQFISNNADRAGACSFRGSSSIHIERALFDGNVATDRFAGAVFVAADVAMEINDSTFRNNRARDNGGAVDISSRSHLLLRDVVFTKNRAGRNGSAIQMHTFTEVEVLRSSFTENQALFGGAIRLSSNSSLSISQSRCTQNEAAFGGCLHADITTTVTISESVFERNYATREGGAIRLYNNSTMSISNTSFERNNATLDGGAIGLYNNSTVSISNVSLIGNIAYNGGALHASDICRVEISNSPIEGNTARYKGGGLSSEAIVKLTIVNSSLTRNEADSGGGCHVQASSTLVITESRLAKNNATNGGCIFLRESNASISHSAFRNNKATIQGGGVYVNRNSNLLASSLTLARNKARGGGAIRMTDNCTALIEYSSFIYNRATTGGGLRIDEHCSVALNSSRLQHNSARNGGAIALQSGSLRVRNTLFSSNRGRNGGGGIYLAGFSFLNATAMSLVSNSASKNGGGICLLGRSSLLCYACLFDDNTASNGAGFYGRSKSQRQAIRAQLHDSSFTRNSALLSGGKHYVFYIGLTFSVGGLQFDTPEDRDHPCFQENTSCGSIVLLNTRFVDNSAVQSGAAILLSDHESVLVAPTLGKDRQEGFLDITDDSFLSPVDYQEQYDSWNGNRVLTRDAGGVVGTYGRSLSLSTNPAKENQIVHDENTGFLLPSVKSGNELPTIQITVLDAFEQSPAPTVPQSFNVSVISPESFFQGVITTNITNGTGSLTNITGFGTPGIYSIKITPLDNEAIGETTLRIQVRNCIIGEEPIRERIICQECGESSFNFHPEKENGCSSCPQHATCEGRYVVPNDGHWHKGPCHANIKQCIRTEACTNTTRVKELREFGVPFNTCTISTEKLLLYNQKLCSKGYEGPLCGSCARSYGLSILYKCSKCPHALESVLTLASLVFYLLVVSSFTLRGGLPYQAKHPSAIARHSSRSTVIWNSSRSVAINIQMVEMMRDGYVPPEVLRPRQSTNRSAFNTQQRRKAEMTGWKTSEIFKITINFLQVTGAAAGVAVHWTDGVMDMFKTSEITGALTTVALFRPVDCLFPSSSALVRSIWRTMFGLFVPGIVVGVFIAYWGVSKIRKKKPMSFFWKRSLLSLMAVVYISYLGLTKLAVRVFYCVDVLDSENHTSASKTSYWAADTAIKCYEKDHFILITIRVIVLIIVTLSFPLVSAFVVTRREEQQGASETWINETMGFLYRAFTNKFRYWESIVMLRKACLSVIVVFAYPLGSQLHTVLALLLLMFSLCLQTVCKPYRREFSTLNHYEYLSLFVSCVTLTLGQSLDSDRCSSSLKEGVAFMIVFINTVTFLVLLLAYLSSGVDHMRAVLETEGIQVPDNSRWWSVLKIVLTTKLSQWCGSST